MPNPSETASNKDPLNIKVTVWLKDGSIFKDWTLTNADIKIGGLPYDIGTLEKVEDAFLYTSNGTKVYRERVTGSIDIVGIGLAGPLKLNVEQVSALNRTTT
jgi:hypothetical protein